ncbi:MAG: TlpA family protein disulfide reductase [Planctomycetota bacterium]
MFPHERSLVERLKDAPFALVGVNSDDTPETVIEGNARERITWPNFFDGGGTGGPIATAWNVRGWPTIYVIDHKGIIRATGVRGAAMDEVVDKLLAELAAEEKRKQDDAQGDNGKDRD